MEYKNLQKTVSLLHNHEYDPNCKFCCDNEIMNKIILVKYIQIFLIQKKS